MAKRASSAVTAQRGKPQPAISKDPTSKTLKMIDAIRAPFAAFVDDFAAITVSRDELAPNFMKAFGSYQSDTGGSFVAFARMLDESIPAEREGYRAHPSFMAADYLRRVAARQSAPAEKPKGPQPVTPMIALARLVATVLPMLGEDYQTLWAAFVKEMHWSDNQVARLQTIVNKEGPITLPRQGAKSSRSLPAPQAAPFVAPRLQHMQTAAGRH